MAGEIPYNATKDHFKKPALLANDGELWTKKPSKWYEAANKKYVDERTPEIRVVSKLPSSPQSGVLYVVVP